MMAKKKVRATGEKAQGLSVSRKALRTGEPPISDLMARAIGTPGLVSLAAGLVDEETLPIREARGVCERVLTRPRVARAALQYGTTLGLKPLREKLLRHIEKLERTQAGKMGFSAGQILLTTGSQQALYLIADVLLDEGDIVIAASPSYFVFAGTLASLGAKVMGVPMDAQGMQVEEVDRLLAKLEKAGKLARVKFIYCTSFFQNPTGLTLSLPRRKRLLEIARKWSRGHRILIVEDAAYRELCYAEDDDAGLPSIKSFDKENRYTVLTQTFSKPFAPGLKLGYTVMPPDLLERVLQQKGNHDFGSANLCQWVALEAMESGLYAKHLARLCSHYRKKRDAILAALRRHMPAGVTWTQPEGGFYVWVTLPEKMTTGPGGGLFEKCLERGVLYVPGEYAFGDAGPGPGAGKVPRNHLRLCFGQVPERHIWPGVKRLALAVKETMEGESGQSAGVRRMSGRRVNVKRANGRPVGKQRANAGTGER